MKAQLRSLFAVLVLSFCVSCEGPQGDPGPAGPKGEPGPAGPGEQSWTYKEGFIKATVEGTQLDGTPYSYDINYQGTRNKDESYLIHYPGYYFFEIKKNYSGEGEPLKSGFASLSFQVANLNDLTNPNFDISIGATKDLGNNNFHSFHLSGQPANSTVSNLNYDDNTGILTGNFSMNNPAGTGPATVTNGSFSVKLVHFVNRKAAD